MNYDNFKGLGDCESFDCQDDYDCPGCEDKKNKLDNAADFLKGVLNQLYGAEDFEGDRLEYCLDELCTYLGVKIPDGDLMIKQKE
jgi:hypothetical protein